MWEKKQDNWPEENKEPEELPHILGFTPSSSQGALSLWVGVPVLFLSKHTVSVCDLPQCGAVSLKINFVPVFCSFYLLKSFLLSEARARSALLLSLVPGGVAARTPGFRPGYSGSRNQGELGSCFKTTHCCLSRSTSHSVIPYDPGSSLHHRLFELFFLFVF